jgi:hypothetical protein
MSLEVYSPTPIEQLLRLELAKRVPSLEGRRVGFIGNLKPNCDVLLHTTEDLLVAQRGVAGTVYREKASCSIGAPAQILDEIAGSCDAAVVALGD